MSFLLPRSLVPTLRVGMTTRTLCVPLKGENSRLLVPTFRVGNASQDALRLVSRDGFRNPEPHARRSPPERENDGINPSFPRSAWE
jgi:hypothetical protein